MLHVDKPIVGDPAPPRHERQRFQIALLCLMEFTLAVPISLLAPFFPTSAKGHGISTEMIGFIMSLYPLVSFLVAPLFSLSMTKLGPKVLILIGGLGSGVCTASFALLNLLEGSMFLYVAIVIRILHGLCSAAANTGTVGLMTSSFSPEDLVQVASSVSVSICLGYLMGPVLGGWLFELGGFALPFYVVGFWTLLIVPFLAFFVPSRTLVPSAGPSSPNSIGFRDVLNTRNVLTMLIVNATAKSVWGVFELSLSLSLNETFQLNAAEIGGVFAIGSVAYAISAMLVGRFSSTAINRYIIFLGLVVTAIALLGLAPVPLPMIPQHSLALAIGSFVVINIGQSWMITPISSELVTMTTHLGTGASDIISGLLVSSTSFGEFVGPNIAGILIGSAGYTVTMCLLSVTFATTSIMFIFFVLC